ncbi:MAG: carbonic anhydrase [Planctomycetota bacterium]
MASWDPSTPGSPMNEWLQYARPSSLVRSDQLLATGDRHNDLAMNNVLRQLDNLRTWPGIAHREISGELRLHAWFYRFEWDGGELS